MFFALWITSVILLYFIYRQMFKIGGEDFYDDIETGGFICGILLPFVPYVNVLWTLIMLVVLAFLKVAEMMDEYGDDFKAIKKIFFIK